MCFLLKIFLGLPERHNRKACSKDLQTYSSIGFYSFSYSDGISSDIGLLFPISSHMKAKNQKIGFSLLKLFRDCFRSTIKVSLFRSFGFIFRSFSLFFVKICQKRPLYFVYSPPTLGLDFLKCSSGIFLAIVFLA